MTPAESQKYFAEWKAAYQTAFASAINGSVFADLAKFCHAYETTVVPGDRDQSYVMEGRRQVYLRIQNFLERTPDELVALYTTQPRGKTNDDIETRSED